MLLLQVAELRGKVRRVCHQLQLLLHDLQILEGLWSLRITLLRRRYDHVRRHGTRHFEFASPAGIDVNVVRLALTFLAISLHSRFDG